ncbi:MAG TPA: hypothetical protein VFU89_08195 [Rhabdochlamydiaceae bacterium]|nr:hypothetical protein [Rhabdochlamydiaceae bacterium]
MIGSVYLLPAGYFALSGLGCGLAASLLKGRTIANWTWMASTMTFQQGAMIGSGMAVVNFCLVLFLREIDKIVWLTQPQKSLAKACIEYSPCWIPPVIYGFCQFPILSYLTFTTISDLSCRTISNLYARACQPKPPFDPPPRWNSVDILDQSVKFRFESSEHGVLKQWIAFTEENYSESLENYKNLRITDHQSKGRAATVIGPFTTSSNDDGILLEVAESYQQVDFLFHQLVIVKKGVAYTLVVGSHQAEFGQYTGLFRQVLSSLKV